MRRRPWTLVILAILHFLAPIGNIFLNAVISGRDIFNYFVMALSPEYLTRNWVIVVAPIVAGFAIYACKTWSFFVYLISLTALFIFSYNGYVSKADAIGFLPVVIVYLVNVGVVSYFLLPAVRSIYFDRRMRWWEIQSRYKCDFQCQWKVDGEDSGYVGQIGNISENGLFIKSDEMPPDHEKILVKIPFNNNMKVHFTGDSILHNRMDAIGFGVKIDHTKESKQEVKKIINELDARGLRITTLDGRPEDTFSYWLRQFLTTGKGFLPKKDK